jgi:hypothetical protein
MYGMEHTEPAGRYHGLATAPAAVANEIDPPAYVFAELDKVTGIGLLEKIQSLGDIHSAGKSMPDQRCRGVVEGHADVHGCLAGPAEVFHLMPAIANTHSPVRGCADDLARPLIVQDMQGIIFRERRLVDQDPPELGITLGEKLFDEVFLLVRVCIEELA